MTNGTPLPPLHGMPVREAKVFLGIGLFQFSNCENGRNVFQLREQSSTGCNAGSVSHAAVQGLHSSEAFQPRKTSRRMDKTKVSMGLCLCSWGESLLQIMFKGRHINVHPPQHLRPLQVLQTWVSLNRHEWFLALICSPWVFPIQ